MSLATIFPPTHPPTEMKVKSSIRVMIWRKSPVLGELSSVLFKHGRYLHKNDLSPCSVTFGTGGAEQVTECAQFYAVTKATIVEAA